MSARAFLVYFVMVGCQVAATKYRCVVRFKFDDVPEDKTPLFIYATWRDTWTATEGDHEHLADAFSPT